MISFDLPFASARLALAVACALALSPACKGRSTEPPVQAKVPEKAAPKVPGSADTIAAQPVPPEPTPTEIHYEPLPAGPLKAQRKVWVQAGFGPKANQFGKSRMEWEEFPPQGFIVTREGKLLLLDTGKRRLLWYTPDGKMERELGLPDHLLFPSDVAQTRDGTLAVMDYYAGSSLFDAQGKYLGSPDMGGEGYSAIYAVGNTIMGISTLGLETLVLTETTKSEGPSTLPIEGGLIQGFVAPDGKTVLNVGVEDEQQPDKFWVSAVQGAEGKPLFKRYFAAKGVDPFMLLQADDAGRVYLVTRGSGTDALFCLDGTTGAPVGRADLPMARGGGAHHRTFSVLPTGGVIQQRSEEKRVTYEWFNCH